MTVVFKSEIKLLCLFGHLRVSPINRLEIYCHLSAMHVMFEITVTDGGAIFFFKPVSFSKIYIKSTVLLYVSVLSGGNGGKQTPFPMKFTSKSVVAVVRQSGGTCKARNYSLNS